MQILPLASLSMAEMLAMKYEDGNGTIISSCYRTATQQAVSEAGVIIVSLCVCVCDLYDCVHMYLMCVCVTVYAYVYVFVCVTEVFIFNPQLQRGLRTLASMH